MTLEPVFLTFQH